MKKLSAIFKQYQETGALNENINLFGFVSDTIFMTKSGSFGAVVSFSGPDYEAMTDEQLETFTHRLRSSFRIFDESFRIYQYLIKSSDTHIPHSETGNPILDQAIQERIRHFQTRKGALYSLDVYFVILFEGFQNKKNLGATIGKIVHNPKESLRILKSHFSTELEVELIQSRIDQAVSVLETKLNTFLALTDDFVDAAVLPKEEGFRFLYRLLNVAPYKLENSKLMHDTFLDYYLCGSSIDCHRDHLEMDEYQIKVLTLKEPTPFSFPLVFSRLMEVPADFYCVTEWQKESPYKINKVIQAKRRHFANTRKSLVASAQDNPEHTLTDESKEALIGELGDAKIQMQMEGSYFGHFSMTIVLFSTTTEAMQRALSEFYRVFSTHDAILHVETLNLLNAFFAAIPGNTSFNLRRMYITDSNYSDYSFLFKLSQGEQKNQHLKKEYLAVLETSHNTPFFLNLHYQDLGHTLILGKSGSGKSFLANFLLTNFQKYDPFTLIFDLGNSYQSLTSLFNGIYLKIGSRDNNISINPFSMSPTEENLDFLHAFVKLLMEGPRFSLDDKEDRLLYQKIQDLYFAEDKNILNLGFLKNTLPPDMKGRLARWTKDISTGEAGQFAYLFDNMEDNVTFADFQTFEFEGLKTYPRLLEALLFYFLHRANQIIYDPAHADRLKVFVIDEAWLFFQNETIRAYIIEALKTWRKKNAMMILITQSVDELKKSDIFNVVMETCPTKIFLANPDMDEHLYQKTLKLNEKEAALVSGLIPKKQFLLKQPNLSKVLNLEVSPKAYWLYTSDPMDSIRRQKAFRKYGFENGLEILSKEVSV